MNNFNKYMLLFTFLVPTLVACGEDSKLDPDTRVALSKKTFDPPKKDYTPADLGDVRSEVLGVWELSENGAEIFVFPTIEANPKKPTGFGKPIMPEDYVPGKKANVFINMAVTSGDGLFSHDHALFFDNSRFIDNRWKYLHSDAYYEYSARLLLINGQKYLAFAGNHIYGRYFQGAVIARFKTNDAEIIKDYLKIYESKMMSPNGLDSIKKANDKYAESLKLYGWEKRADLPDRHEQSEHEANE